MIALDCSHERLIVCARCRRLRGVVQEDVFAGQPGGPWRQVPRLQHCCTFTPTEEVPGPSQVQNWPGFDFPTAFQLCRGCAVRVLRSDSRHAPSFCAACKQRVLEHNELAGWRIVPLSGYGLPNSELLRKKEAREPGVTETFFRRTGGMSGLLDRLSAWRRVAVEETLARCRLPLDEDVPLLVYLDAAARRPVDEVFRFQRMLEFLFDERRPAFAEAGGSARI